jgi:capsular polysaccharide export protein
LKPDDLFLSRLIFVGFANWKRKIVENLFDRRSNLFLRYDATRDLLPADLLSRPEHVRVLIWGSAECDITSWYRSATGREPIRIEDGFLRSYGIGAARIPPNVLVFDRSGIYFDAHRPSDLEVSLQNEALSEALLNEAQLCLDLWKNHALSKYVLPVRRPADAVYGPKTKPRVLVLGQVADDASMRLGAPPGARLNDIVKQAAAENPHCEIIYKIHPDVLAGLRHGDPAYDDIAGICTIVKEALPLPEAFKSIDRVYTYTSLAGFEAVLHGLPVTVLGAPFYAGWGLTDDRWTDAPCMKRRTRRRSALEVFAAAYLQHSVYFDPVTGLQCSMAETIERIADHRAHDIDTRQRSLLKKLRVALRRKLFGLSDRKSGLIGKKPGVALVPKAAWQPLQSIEKME